MGPRDVIERLQKVREARRVSRAHIARATKRSPQHVWQAEMGKAGASMEFLSALHHQLGGWERARAERGTG